MQWFWFCKTSANWAQVYNKKRMQFLTEWVRITGLKPLDKVFQHTQSLWKSNQRFSPKSVYREIRSHLMMTLRGSLLMTSRVGYTKCPVMTSQAVNIPTSIVLRVSHFWSDARCENWLSSHVFQDFSRWSWFFSRLSWFFQPPHVISSATSRDPFSCPKSISSATSVSFHLWFLRFVEKL